VFNCAI